MLKLPQKTRAVIADKFADAANLSAAALVLGQGFSDGFSVPMACAGMVLWAVLFSLALWASWGDQ